MPKLPDDFYTHNEKCPLCGIGTLKFIELGDGCSCHLNAPCAYCTDSYHECDMCGADSKCD